MTDCCNDKACEIVALRTKQTSTLQVVLGINAAMFGVELAAGIAAGSVSLVADSLDMFGDALVYGFSIYAVAHGAREKAQSALLKGGIMAAFGFMVLAQAGYRVVHPETPVVELIGGVGLMALVANGLCLALLWRHRSDDINMSSVWLCSRNDIIANVSVLCAAAGVWMLGSAWPDIVVGTALAMLFFRSATSVVRDAIRQLRLNPPVSSAELYRRRSRFCRCPARTAPAERQPPRAARDSPADTRFPGAENSRQVPHFRWRDRLSYEHAQESRRCSIAADHAVRTGARGVDLLDDERSDRRALSLPRPCRTRRLEPHHDAF